MSDSVNHPAHYNAHPSGVECITITRHMSFNYALNAACVINPYNGTPIETPESVGWCWDRSWWKPTTPRRDLVKAAALILAEIERIDRAAAAETGEEKDDV